MVQVEYRRGLLHEVPIASSAWLRNLGRPLDRVPCVVVVAKAGRPQVLAAVHERHAGDVRGMSVNDIVDEEATVETEVARQHWLCVARDVQDVLATVNVQAACASRGALQVGSVWQLAPAEAIGPNQSLQGTDEPSQQTPTRSPLDLVLHVQLCNVGVPVQDAHGKSLRDDLGIH